jgi:phage shock protein A
LTAIVRANVNDMLDDAEDPEKMLNQIIRDMDDALQQGQSQVAEQIAQQKMLEADLDNAQAKVAEWNRKAELAVSKGADDLAREALGHVRDYEQDAAATQKQLEAQRTVVENLKQKLAELQRKLDGAVHDRERLIARAKRAQATAILAQAAQKISIADYSSDLARMERKIQMQEARAAAQTEIAEGAAAEEDKFAKLGADDDLEARLAELKKKAGK